ncbi:MAG: autotransporter-associated beta strand repeat-containing protein, partial [Planctomycetes bacterium]|nr:autotransporter-associated beta strand repeat-containing protein [Planctomycetota bacterium]
TGVGAIGDVTVTGGTLGGTGTVGDIVLAGGQVRPGTAGAKGTLTAGSTTLSGTSDPTIRVRVAAFTLPGTNYDRLALGDGLVLTGDATLVVDLAGVVGTGTAVGAIAFSPPDVRSGLFAHVRVENSGGRSARAQYTKDGIDIVVDDLIAHWRLDESSGVVVSDATGNGHDGTIVAGSPVWMPGAGRIDGALSLDGEGDPISLGVSTALQPASLSLTYWVKRTTDWSTVNDAPIWAKDTDLWDGMGWYAQILDVPATPDRAVGFAADGPNAAWVAADANTFFPIGRWTHVAITFDTGTNAVAIYRDGVAQALSTVGTPATITASASLKNMARRCEAPYDDMRLYGRALTAGEVLALVNERRSTWDGGGGNILWTTAANWVGDVAPVADEELVFAGILRTTNSNDFPAATPFHSLAFDVGGFALGGNGVALANGISALAGTNVVGTAVTLSQDQSWSVLSGATVTASNVVSGAGDLSKLGDGSLVFTGANTFTGGLTVTEGIVSAQHISACGAVGTGTTVSDGGALAVHGVAIGAEPLSLDGDGPGSAGALRCTAAGSWSGVITLADDSRISGGPGLTLPGAIGGAGGMTVDGLLILTGSGTGAWTGGTTIATGTLRLVGGDALPDAYAVTFANVAGATLDLDDGTETIGGLAGGGATGGLVDLGSGTLTIDASGTTSFAGATTGTGGLVKLGSGVQILTGTGGATGPTLISGGTLRVAGGGALSDASAVTITPLGIDTVYVEDALPAGATPDVSNETWNWVASAPAPYSGTLAHQSASVAGMHQHYFYDATATMTVPAGAVFFQYVWINPLDPPRELMIQWHATDGSTWEHRAYWGTPELYWGTDGTDSYRSFGAMPPLGQWVRLEIPASLVGLEGITVSGMAYSLAGGQVTWDRSGWSTLPSPALDLAGANEAIGSLAGIGIVTLGTGTLTTGGDGTSTTYAGTITGSGGLTKLGAGAFTLSSANPLTGTTTVSAGQLLVDGSTASSSVSLSGGTLGGIGTTGGIASAGTGGVIRPATSGARGALHAGTTDLSGGSAPALRLRIAAYATAGVSFDQLDLATASGGLTLGGTSTLILDLNGLATTGTAAGVVTF